MNSIFSTLAQFFFLLVVIVAFVAVVKFFRRSIAPKINKEWQPIALLATLSAMALFSTLTYFSLTGSEETRLQKIEKGEVLTDKLNDGERTYLMRVNPDLKKLYERLEKAIENTDQFKSALYQLNDNYPNHTKLLSKTLGYFSHESAEQKKIFNRVHKEVRYAQIQEKTQDSVSVNKYFAERAKRLNMEIKKVEQSANTAVKKATAQVAQSLNEARKILIRGHSKKGSKVTKHSFLMTTEVRLLDFLEKRDADIHAQIEELDGAIKNAEEKKEEMRKSSMQNKELAQPLIKTMNLWRVAEESARQHRNDLLYAVEAIYIAERFNMPKHNPNYLSLFKTLKSQSARKLASAKKKNMEASRSISSPDYVNKAN